MMSIRLPLHLYLDFDGCLHSDAVYWQSKRGIYCTRGMLFEHAPALEGALAPFSELRIVLSTSWVSVLGFSRALKRLPPGLRARVVGATYHSCHTPNWRYQPRYLQIIDDVKRRGLGVNWLAIDDDTEDWPDSRRDQLIAPRGEVGLQAVDLALLVQRIRGRW